MTRWIGSWHASQTKFDTRFFDFTFPQVSFENQTLRMVVHPHAPGSILRLKFSNRYGVEPLTIGKVTVARHLHDGKINTQTDGDVTFQGESSVTIPVGEEIYSDPVSFKVNAQSDLAVSMYLPSYTKTSTWHFTPARSTYVATGDHTKESDTTHFNTIIDSYYWLTGLDVMTEAEHSCVIVAIGDSITEGFSSTLNANHRWPDFLRDRVYQEYPKLNCSVLNAGITGNLISIDVADVEGGADLGLANAGEKTPIRLHWDVFSQTGVTDVILLQGINDIFGNADADQIIASMKEVATKVQQRNLRIFIGTITPFAHSDYYSEDKEAIRQKVNQWIRSNEIVDGIIDFDQALANPQTPNKIHPAYDSGDHLHPNDEGFKAFAYAVPLSLFFKGEDE
ncbi:SGNH/GDSL hydrolase family protein [Desmospora activa]|uniref:Lysophospholipase L1-like esterase n=1 Tax=Desmospora activa DSM 45169 TaxID=1121389 RepID=A0A2T4Z9P6_9BACL|nr:SGNH/GDSL hydrolase family protein [Desmospora activa]PTM58612.1 lysophospholipase L1-like esterase [Desmospora activa DSM 45169]